MFSIYIVIYFICLIFLKFSKVVFECGFSDCVFLFFHHFIDYPSS